MRRILAVASLFALFAAVPHPAPAALPSGCCACIEQPHAQTSGPPSNVDALFCGQVGGTGYPEFAQRCDNVGGDATPCFPPSPGVSCTTTLAGEGIVCPAAPGAPTASSGGLAILAVALTALGLGMLRRRVR